MKKPQPQSGKPEFYEGALHIDDTKLNDMCREQPEALYRVARALVMAQSRRDAAKQDLREEEAQSYARAVHRLTVDGEQKVTVDAVKAQQAIDTQVLKSRDELLAREVEVGEWAALKEAFLDRSQMLRECVKLYLAQHYTTTGTLNEMRTEVSRPRPNKRK